MSQCWPSSDLMPSPPPMEAHPPLVPTDPSPFPVDPSPTTGATCSRTRWRLWPRGAFQTKRVTNFVLKAPPTRILEHAARSDDGANFKCPLAAPTRADTENHRNTTNGLPARICVVGPGQQPIGSQHLPNRIPDARDRGKHNNDPRGRGWPGEIMHHLPGRHPGKQKGTRSYDQPASRFVKKAEGLLQLFGIERRHHSLSMT